ncbi:MAG: J domain-containing protein [Chloroflexi bacterium]|nr:J domain-containing protein [Chloroflexota bacterium]
MATTSTTDYYAILGISRTANDKEIRQAYRRLARKYHPDVNPGNKAAEQKFKEIQRAYEVLSDPEKRAKYDKYGEHWEQISQQGGFDPRHAGNPFGSDGFGGAGYQYGTGNLNYDDILERLFGDLGRRAGGGRRARRGQDHEQPVEITLEEAYHGTQRVLQIQAADGHTRRLEVKIPAGVRNGSRITISGQGGPGVGGGAPGDLYLIVSLLPHNQLELKGDDLHIEVPVPLTTLVLGGEVRVPTPKGEVALKIPPETQNGRVFRLNGLGMPKVGSNGKGDLFARVKAILPTRLTDREKELFQQLSELQRT